VDSRRVYLQNTAYRLGVLDKSLIKKFMVLLAPSRHECLLTQEDPQSFRQAMEFAQDHEDVIKADKVYSGQHKGV
jgi:hypothetical protein